jgi:hypothetical protein
MGGLATTVIPWYYLAMGRAKKIAVSFDEELAADIAEAAAGETDGNVSAWLASAARAELRRKALREAVAAFEAENGVITDAEVDEARRKWR